MFTSAFPGSRYLIPGGSYYSWRGVFNYQQGRYQFARGYKQYELSNHLGNVLTTVQDRKWGQNDSAGTSFHSRYYLAYVATVTDYYAFGSTVKERTASFTQKYRFGFNNQEQEIELGDYYSFEYRVHDARLGRFLSVDPHYTNYWEVTTYHFCLNNPISLIDVDGRDVFPSNRFATSQASKAVYSILNNYDKNSTNKISVILNSFYMDNGSKRFDLDIDASPEQTCGLGGHWPLGAQAQACDLWGKRKQKIEFNALQFFAYSEFEVYPAGEHEYLLIIPTDLSIARTFVHELIHSYVSATNRSPLSSKQSHDLIANEYFEDAVAFLEKWANKMNIAFPAGVDRKTCIAGMFWQGLQESDRYQQMFGRDDDPASWTNEQNSNREKYFNKNLLKSASYRTKVLSNKQQGILMDKGRIDGLFNSENMGISLDPQLSPKIFYFDLQ
jgi:RHS repeat-associated protein